MRNRTSLTLVLLLALLTGNAVSALAQSKAVTIVRQPARADSARLLPYPPLELILMLEQEAQTMKLISEHFARMMKELDTIHMDGRAVVTRRLIPPVLELQERASNSMFTIMRICSEGPNGDAGYVGVGLEEQILTAKAGTKNAPAAFPTVRLVERGSPAERAGLDTGDVILKVNGMDPRGKAFSVFLGKPGERVSLRVSNAGREREIDVELEARGARVQRTCEVAFTPREYGTLLKRDSVAAQTLNIGTIRFSRDTARTLLATATRAGGSSAGGGVLVAQDFVVATSPAVVGTSVSIKRFLGATLSNVSPTYLARRGVEKGVNVLFVEEESRAATAGLKGSDIVMKVRKTAVSNTTEFMKAVEAAGGAHSIELEIMRDLQPKIVTITMK